MRSENKNDTREIQASTLITFTFIYIYFLTFIGNFKVT